MRRLLVLLLVLIAGSARAESLPWQKWDSSLLAYAPPERTRILPEKYRSIVIAKNGDVVPTVLVDGVVAATWDMGTKRDLTIRPLRHLTKQERTAIDDEGERLAEFFRS